MEDDPTTTKEEPATTKVELSPEERDLITRLVHEELDRRARELVQNFCERFGGIAAAFDTDKKIEASVAEVKELAKTTPATVAAKLDGLAQPSSPAPSNPVPVS